MKLLKRYKDKNDLFTINHKDTITIGLRTLDRETYEPIMHEAQEFNNYGTANLYNQNLSSVGNIAGRIYYDFDTEIWLGGYFHHSSDERMYSFFQYNRDKIYMTQHLTLKNGNVTGCHQYTPTIIQWDKFRNPIMMSQHIGTNSGDHIREMYYILHNVEANTAHGIYMSGRTYYNLHIPEFRFDDMNWSYSYEDNTGNWPRHDRNGVQLIHVDQDTESLYWFSNNNQNSHISVVKIDASGAKQYLNLKDQNVSKNLIDMQGGDSIVGLDHMYRYKSNFPSQWQEFNSATLQGWKYYPLIKKNSTNTHSYPLIVKYNFNLNGEDDSYPDSLEECIINWGDYNPDINMFESIANLNTDKTETDCWTFKRENGESILNFMYSYTNGFIYLLSFTIDQEDPKILNYNNDIIEFKSYIKYPKMHCITKDFKLVLLNRQLNHHEFISWDDDQGWTYRDFIYSDANILYDDKKKRVITKTVQTNAKSYNIYAFQSTRIALTGLRDDYVYADSDITENLKLNVYNGRSRTTTKVVIRVLTPNAKIIAHEITYTPYDNTSISYIADNIANADDLNRIIFDNAATFDSSDADITYDMFYNADKPVIDITSDYNNAGPVTLDTNTSLIDTNITPSDISSIEFKINAIPTGDFALFGATANKTDNFYFCRIDGTWGIGLGDSDQTSDSFTVNEDINTWTDGITLFSAIWDGDKLEIYQDGNLLGSKTLSVVGGAVSTNTVYIGNANDTSDPLGAITTFSDIYVNKVETSTTDGVNDPMNIIFESISNDTTWGELRTTADANNSFNTSKFNVYSSMDQENWELKYSSSHEQNADYAHPIQFMSKYAKIEVIENNADDGVGRILVQKDPLNPDNPNPWWDIIVPIVSSDSIETHIGEFQSSSVSDTIVPLIIKGTGSVELETYAMSIADHTAAFGIIPAPAK